MKRLLSKQVEKSTVGETSSSSSLTAKERSRIECVFGGVAQVIRKTSKVASSRKFPPQKAVTCCMMTR